MLCGRLGAHYRSRRSPQSCCRRLAVLPSRQTVEKEPSGRIGQRLKTESITVPQSSPTIRKVITCIMGVRCINLSTRVCG